MSRTFVLLYLLSIYLHSGDGAAKRIVRQLTYTTKYDNFDVDAVLNNQRLLRSYANCLLDKGSCTAEGKELKSKLIMNVVQMSDADELFSNRFLCNFNISLRRSNINFVQQQVFHSS